MDVWETRVERGREESEKVALQGRFRGSQIKKNGGRAVLMACACACALLRLAPFWCGEEWDKSKKREGKENEEDTSMASQTVWRHARRWCTRCGTWTFTIREYLFYLVY